MRPASHRILALLAAIVPALSAAPVIADERPKVDAVQVAPDGSWFVLVGSGQRFTPWGFNYSTSKRLIEDFWDDDWDTLAGDFREMREMGANVVRIHPQFAKFMDGPDAPNDHALAQLKRVIDLAEETGLYLDITGLGCFRKEDVPPWYDALDETGRWAAQAVFWRAVAAQCKGEPAVFCLDLMNEPLAPPGGAETRKPGDWLTGKLGPHYFLQYVSLDRAGRHREDVVVAWKRSLTAAIREVDLDRMVTVGLLPSTPKWGHFSGFRPDRVAAETDFVSVHIYPEKGKVPEAIATLKQFAVARKPLVVEETFPLTCSPAELREFLLASRGVAHGWMWHYEGQSIADLEALRAAKQITIPQAMMLNALRLFQEVGPEMLGEAPAQYTLPN